jgi:hypothetical protein
MANNSLNRTPLVVGSRFAPSGGRVCVDGTTLATVSAYSFTMSSTWRAVFVGYAPITVGAVSMNFFLKTPASYTGAPSNYYMEIGLCKGLYNFQMSGVNTLSVLSTVNIQGIINSTTNGATAGLKRIVFGHTASPITGTTISIGTPLWIVFGYNATGGTGVVAPILTGGGFDPNASGILSSGHGASVLAISNTVGPGANFPVIPDAPTNNFPWFSLKYYTGRA